MTYVANVYTSYIILKKHICIRTKRDNMIYRRLI